MADLLPALSCAFVYHENDSAEISMSFPADPVHGLLIWDDRKGNLRGQ